MHHCTQDDPLAQDLNRFWELEEVPRRSFLTPDEEQCESHFRANTTRTADGRYVVRLPFRAGPPINIGQSRPLADQIHRSLQQKFRLNSSLASEYRAFLHEYEELGHMRRALSSSTSSTQAVYMPHHPVFRQGSATTFPLARPILRSNIYVDDVLFGGDDFPSLRRSCDQLNGLLHCGHFELRKWASNHSELLTDMDPSDHGLACSKFLTPDDEVKILGVSWNPSRDAFQFQVSLSNTLPSTKRTILSTIAKFYDPLEGSPLPLSPPRLSFRTCGASESHGTNRSPALHLIAGPRFTLAFCQITVSLLAGKSKVAPLTPVTIPRLELQGAELLSRLMAFVLSAFENATVKCFCWTDSTVVLAWLRSHPSKWKPYVANRVANIQTRLPNASWQHVPTAENPADCASRGLLSDDLLRHELWWHGPEWLGLDVSAWPSQTPLPEGNDLPEVKVSFHSASTPSIEWDLASRFSKWPKLLRVTAYIIRFSRLCRRNISDTPSRPSGQALSTSDVSLARIFWIKHLQSVEFPEELHALQQAQSLSPKSPLLSLSPFLDADGIIRVGGRLRHASLPHRVRHPILLAPHPIVRLLVEQVHIQTLHGGVQLTLHTLRQNYWLLRARSMVKSIIHAFEKELRSPSK
ncbi:uncharacterized protein LOC143218170 [Lasioglossum baleicum]|uniref:uncharacterized protein LOC143218170 n=1 Tax=Lasioglossum baleicum TaxID=434251 RepID=UPI003FCDA812